MPLTNILGRIPHSFSLSGRSPGQLLGPLRPPATSLRVGDAADLFHRGGEACALGMSDACGGPLSLFCPVDSAGHSCPRRLRIRLTAISSWLSSSGLPFHLIHPGIYLPP